MLPSDDILVICLKFALSLNLLCSYPITVAPCNAAVEVKLVDWLKHSPKKLYWAQNFSRFLVTATGCVLGVCLAGKIDKFLALVGAFLCAPLALFFPALLYYN